MYWKVRFGATEASIPVDVSPVANPVEEDPITFDVVADAVVADAHPPLADRHIGQRAALIGVLLQSFKGIKHAPMGLGVEPAQITAEAIGDDECKAGHTRRASSPGVL